jgi:hypothetical protein
MADVAPVALRRRVAVGRCRQHSVRQARMDRPVDKRRASHPLTQTAFKLASFLRHPCLAHALVNPLAAREIDRMVAERRGSEPRDGESGVKFQSRPRGFARFFKTPDTGERGS